MLALLALELVSVPASQAYVERVFSMCGIVCVKKRNRASVSLERWVFLKFNNMLMKIHWLWNCELTENTILHGAPSSTGQWRTMGHFILGLHQRLTQKFKTKPLIQSPETGVKPFLRLNWCKTLVLTWIFGQPSYIVFHQPQRPRKDEHSQLRCRFLPTVWLRSISAISVTIPWAPYLFVYFLHS